MDNGTRISEPVVVPNFGAFPWADDMAEISVYGMPFFVEKRLSCCLCAKSVAVTIDGICLACLGCPSHLQAVIEAKAEADHD